MHEFLAFLASLLLIMLTAGLVFAVGAGTGVWLLLRAARRRRVVGRLRHGALTVRAYTRTGSARQLAGQRLQLRNAVAATARSLAWAQSNGRPVGELPAIAHTLERAAQGIDGQLGLAERDPDPAVRQAMNIMLAQHVEQLTHTASGVRQALLQTGSEIGAAQIRAVSAQLAVEAQALQAWTLSYRGRGTGTAHGRTFRSAA